MTALFSLVLWVVSLNAQISMGALSMPGPESKKSPVDKLRFIAQYEMAYVQDTSKPDEITEETMILKVGERVSQFYSYTKFVSDSLFRIQMARSDGMMVRREGPGGGGGGGGSANQGQINYQIFKNYPAGKVTTLERIGPSQFRCEEANACPEWQVLPDTATMLDYLCYKATTHFKGRDYTAWFTPDIPRGEGPWKLCGLPGLILYAEDSRKEFVFECTGLLNARPDEMIEYGADTYEPVSREALSRAYARFASDPIGYVTSNSPNRVVFKGPDGADIRPTNLPYNPIELAE